MMFKQSSFSLNVSVSTAENTGLQDLDLSWNHFRNKGGKYLAKGLGVSVETRLFIFLADKCCKKEMTLYKLISNAKISYFEFQV